MSAFPGALKRGRCPWCYSRLLVLEEPGEVRFRCARHRCGGRLTVAKIHLDALGVTVLQDPRAR